MQREEDLDNPLQHGGSSSSGIHVGTKVEDVAPDIVPASPSYSESLGVSHGTEGIRRVVKRRWIPEKEENEDQAQEGLPDEEEPLGSEEEALRNEGVIQSRLDKFNEVTETLMSNLQKTARDHLQMCRSDFQFRCTSPNRNARMGAGPIVPHMNKIFGPGHKALEGFDDYEESSKTVLVDEMTSLLETADLAKDTPMPSVLRKEKRKIGKLSLPGWPALPKELVKELLVPRLSRSLALAARARYFLESPAIGPKWRT